MFAFLKVMRFVFVYVEMFLIVVSKHWILVLLCSLLLLTALLFLSLLILLLLVVYSLDYFDRIIQQ